MTMTDVVQRSEATSTDDVQSADLTRSPDDEVTWQTCGLDDEALAAFDGMYPTGTLLATPLLEPAIHGAAHREGRS